MDERTELFITSVLRRMGVSRVYCGFPYLLHALSLVLEDDTRMQRMGKEIYSATAEAFEVTSVSVERNLRTISRKAWRTAPEFICQMAGCTLEKQPTTSEFIEILAGHIKVSLSNKSHFSQ